MTWRPGDRISSADDYRASLRGRDLRVHLKGERVSEPGDHPVIAPSINAMAETYELADTDPSLASATSGLIDEPVNRFLHVTEDVSDVVAQNQMQRRLGQRTGTCFQRCVGMDAINALFSVTFDIDAASGTSYHQRFRTWLADVQRQNLVVGGAMTDPKGDRSLPPHKQHDPDLFVHVVGEDADGIVIRGAKAHQTGALNSHWLLVMPTQRLGESDSDYAVVAAVPVDAPGITYIYGRQASDDRAYGSGIDAGNACYAGQEVMVVLDDVRVPEEHVFMQGEWQFAADLVERFTAYHRRSYVCKSGVGDVLIGAAALAAQLNGVDKASHVRDKLVEMVHLNETIYAAGIAASYESFERPAGNFENDGLLANICKHNVTRFPYEIGRLAQDLAGGLLVTMPGDEEFSDAEIGPVLDNYLSTGLERPTEERRRVLRLIENMTMGRNAVGYLTESLHGAGSPQAQRVQIERQADLAHKRSLARRLAGITTPEAADTPATNSQP